MVYRIAGGLFLVAFGLNAVGVAGISLELVGILALIGGVGLLVGL